jgi:excisionase family DNA binding protein
MSSTALPEFPSPDQHKTKLLDPIAAANLLGVSRTTLAGWRCTKRYSLPYVKFGRVVRYHEADLLAFLQQHTVGREAL